MKILIPILLVCFLTIVASCGKTLDQLKQAIHATVDIGFEAVEDGKDTVETLKETWDKDEVPTP